MLAARPTLRRTLVLFAANIAGRAPMTTLAPGPWTDLAVAPHELRPANVLVSGQVFHWRARGENEWAGVVDGRALAVRQTATSTEYRLLTEAPAHEAAAAAASLRDYFQLDEPLAPLYEDWRKADARCAAVTEALPGLRVLRVDPLECLVGFICSSNNNIGRIGLMMQRLRVAYGAPLVVLDPAVLEAHIDAQVVAIEDDGGCDGGYESSGDEAVPYLERSRSVVAARPPGTSPQRFAAESTAALPAEVLFATLHAFPSLEALARLDVGDLETLGFGYRGKFIVGTAKELVSRGGGAYLKSLRDVPYDETVESLKSLLGVGPKVADCVALFSLDKVSAIPVDVHVYRIARRDLDPSLPDPKSMTPSLYARIGGLFRDRYGSHAGWAHSVLFAAELPQFRKLLPPGLQQTMAAFAAFEKAENAKAKVEKAMRAEAKKAAGSAAAAAPAKKPRVR